MVCLFSVSYFLCYHIEGLHWLLKFNRHTLCLIAYWKVLLTFWTVAYASQRICTEICISKPFVIREVKWPLGMHNLSALHYLSVCTFTPLSWTSRQLIWLWPDLPDSFETKITIHIHSLITFRYACELRVHIFVDQASFDAAMTKFNFGFLSRIRAQAPRTGIPGRKGFCLQFSVTMATATMCGFLTSAHFDTWQIPEVYFILSEIGTLIFSKGDFLTCWNNVLSFWSHRA